MRRMKGGVDDYKIEQVLGTQFQQFIQLLDNKTFDPFLVKNVDKTIGTFRGTNLAANAKENDIYYEFFEFLVAATAAFREIEKPDWKAYEVASRYGETSYAIFDELISGKTTGVQPVPKQVFGFKQLPYKHNDSQIKFLVPGFHLIPFVKYDTRPQPNVNGLINLFRYLEHFIALLDTQNLTGSTVIDFLKQDNLYFNKYLDDLLTALASDQFFMKNVNISNTNVLFDAVYKGLAAVATQIINNYNALPLPPTLSLPNALNITFPLDLTNTNYSKWLKSVGFADLGGDTVNALNNAVLALNNLRARGGQVAATNETPQKIDEHTTNGLYNAAYLLDASIAKSIDVVQTGGNCMMSGGKIPIPGQNKDAAGGVGSLDHLYGPIGKDASTPPKVVRNLISVGLQGTDDAGANLVGQALQANLANINNTANFVIAKNAENVAALLSRNVIPQITNAPAPIVALVAHIQYMIEKGTSVVPAADADIFKDYIRNAQINATPVLTRIKTIPTANFETKYQDFKEAFVAAFALEAGQYLQFNQGKLVQLQGPIPQGKSGVRRPSAVTKNSLAVPELKKFYQDVVLSNPSFYSKFFNLVKSSASVPGGIENPDIDIADAFGKTDAELQNYRLNVRKEKGFARLTGGQRGGLFGDIILLSYIPDYTPGLGDLWTSANQKILASQLQAQGIEAIRNIVRQIYNSDPSVSVINIYGVDVNLIDAASAVSGAGVFRVDWNTYYKTIISKPLFDTTPASKPGWKENEDKLTEHMLRSASEWVREGDNFVRRDKNGNAIDDVPVNSCAFIDINARECLDFLDQCAFSTDPNFPAACAQLLDAPFQTNPGINNLREQIVKINPKVAFAILRQFKFASYLAEETTDPFKGFRRYKVQSVGSWLEELYSNSDRCAKPVAPVQGQCDPRTLRDQLGANIADIIIQMSKEPSKYPFFTYLDMLVEWVNANPQVLNPEEIKNPSVKSNYPDINNSFRTYDYLNPYKPADVRLRNVSCGLERLKSSIVNELAGYNAPALISNITNIPLGIEMPLNRSAFINPYPVSSVGLGTFPMLGGYSHNVEQELQNISSQYGYNLFEQIYKDLTGTLNSLQDRKIKLSPDTQNRIEQKLSNFKKLEDELRKSMVNIIEKNKLYQASRGYVNAYIVPDDKLAEVITKHSNLLNLSSAYNRRSINLIDLFQTLTRAILGKLEVPATGSVTGNVTGIAKPSTYDRPITMGYRPPYPGKN